MKVKKLIEKLQEYNPEYQVVVRAMKYYGFPFDEDILALAERKEGQVAIFSERME